MLYSQLKPIYNTTADELAHLNLNAIDKNLHFINQSGEYLTTQYQPQNKGAPNQYLVNSNGLTVTLAVYNDTCNLNVEQLKTSYKRVDLSGKRLQDILPKNILTGFSSENEYMYINESSIYGLMYTATHERNPNFENLLNSTATFPNGSIVYLPTSMIADQHHFLFDEIDITKYTDLQTWVNEQKISPPYQYKQEIIGGLKVAYPIDAQGKPAYLKNTYSMLMPAIEKNGKVYEALWTIKGDLMSPDYGVKLPHSDMNSQYNYYFPAEYAQFNKISYEFITSQIQTYYR